jgi:hypothetical protein
MTLLSTRTRICAAAVFCAFLVVGAALLAMERRSVYGEEGVDLAPAALQPTVHELALPDSRDRAGGLVAVDLDGDRPRDFIITGIGYIAAFGGSGTPLWSKNVDIQITGKAEDEGLPGLHAPGVQAADIDGDGATEVLFLTRSGTLQVLGGTRGPSGRPFVCRRRPRPLPAGSIWWWRISAAGATTICSSRRPTRTVTGWGVISRRMRSPS